MDVIRSAYVGQVRFVEGGPTVPVTWFFAADGAAVYEPPTIFRSFDFEPTPKTNNGLGPQYPPRGAWRAGMRPAGFNGRLSCSSFAPEWWQSGIPVGTILPVPRLPNGLPLCCAPVNAPLLFGGSAKVKRWRLYGPPSGIQFGGSASTSSFRAGGGIEFSGSAMTFP